MAEPRAGHDDGDDFYVGYAPGAPPALARFTRRVVVGVAGFLVTLALVVVLAQTPFAPASFEYGVSRSFRGTMHATPFPTLVVARPGALAGAGGATSSFLLVAPGKHGAAELARRFDGAAVELTGTLVYREGHTMIEVVPDAVTAAVLSKTDAGPLTVEDLGPVRLAGEIVDTKCHLGVMNPGDGKTHRGCAVRCISGGIPPALRVRDGDGGAQLFLLVGAAGETVNHALLPFVAEPVEVTGRAERRGDLLVLYADPAAIRRLGEEG